MTCKPRLDGRSRALRHRPHPILPSTLIEARLANEMASDLLDEGIYVIGFS